MAVVTVYLINDHRKVLKSISRKKKTKLSEKLNIYSKQIENIRINNLISNLKKYNYRTKNDLKLAIDYYNNEIPTKINSDFLGWIVSLTLTLSSFIEIAYNPETETIDSQKISVILGSTLGIIFVFLISIVVLKIIINGIFMPKEQLHSALIADLSYIYLNFDTYKNQLTKN